MVRCLATWCGDCSASCAHNSHDEGGVMHRASSARAVAAGIVLLAFGGCHAKLEAKAEISIGSSGGGYAAMDEVEVSGGELRLATPVAITLDDGTDSEAIAFPLRHT